jgi:glucose-1-phosphate adenylyltransferase
MGAYLFSRNALQPLLNNVHPDFGREIIPGAVSTHRVFSYLFKGYWQDVGSIRSFFEANLDLVSDLPRFNFFELAGTIFSQPLYLPGAKVNGARIDHTLLAGGCIVNQATISHSIVGPRYIVGAGTQLRRVISMGSDYYESAESVATHQKAGLPRVGIGRNARIEDTIIDRNARIGDNVVISPAGKPASVDHEHYFIRDGVVIVPRNGTIPHNSVI